MKGKKRKIKGAEGNERKGKEKERIGNKTQSKRTAKRKERKGMILSIITYSDPLVIDLSGFTRES